MRRKDREIKNFEDIIRVMEKCDVCRLALHDEGYPYIVPLNFGMEVSGQKITLYFHGALTGKKYDLIRKDNRVCFEMDCSHSLVMDEENGNCTMAYESVIGRGLVEIMNEEEKYHALCILMKHYHQEDFSFNRAVMPNTAVFRLTVESVTGKSRRK